MEREPPEALVAYVDIVVKVGQETCPLSSLVTQAAIDKSMTIPGRLLPYDDSRR